MPNAIEDAVEHADGDEVMAEVQLNQAISCSKATAIVLEEVADGCAVTNLVMEKLQTSSWLSPLQQEVNERARTLVGQVVVAEIHAVKRTRTQPLQTVIRIFSKPPPQAIVAPHHARQMNLTPSRFASQCRSQPAAIHVLAGAGWLECAVWQALAVWRTRALRRARSQQHHRP